MKSSTRVQLFPLLAAIFCLLLTGTIAAGQSQRSVAILPFSLNAPPDLQYLQEGLRDMLGSRMRAEVGARIIAETEADAALKAAGGKPAAENLPGMAKQLGADYLVYGSVTALGGGISIDTQVFTAAPAGQALQTFYSSATANDQIMQSIDALAWDIIEKMFHKQRPAIAAPVQQAPAQPGAPSAFTTAHPDKTFMASGGGFGIKSGRSFVKTRNFNMGVRGLDVADVDGDGAMEVILADKSEVQIFDRDETRLNLIGTIQVPGNQTIHSVNAADLDSDGKAEIYISANDPQAPGSMAVEWDGKQFATLFKNARWYIRPMNIPGTGTVLVGQASGMIPVTEGIYVLTVNNGSLDRQERLPLPAKVNLFSFAYADLDGNGQKEVVALDESFKLQVVRGGDISWKSEERFCGTKRYVGGEPRMMPTTTPTTNREVDGVGERFKETYIPSRILVADVDHDGADDIILNLNPSTLTTVMPRMIQYMSGTLVGLKWNGLGLEEMWRTRKIDGYVVDYQAKSQVMKLKEGEEDELFIAVVLNSGTFESLTTDQSTVVIYPFEFEAPAKK